jgi:5'-deoxynucleotidase YfbR-like HD superfamily hydrolase
MPKPLPELLADLRREPSEGVLRNVISDLLEHNNRPLQDLARRIQDQLRAGVSESTLRARILEVDQALAAQLGEGSGLRGRPLAHLADAFLDGGKRRTQSAKFGACVKAVRKTVKARKGSNPESAAIAICTKSMLFPRGRTIKRYRKGRLLTQKRRA